MKHVTFSILLFLALNQLWASAPTWTVNKQQFAYTMTFTGVINIDGQELNATSDMLAAFVGEQCRGVSQLIYDATAKRHVFFLSVYGNQTGDTLSFKTFVSKSDRVVELPQKLVFTLNENKGSALRPFTLSSPALSSEAGFASVNVDGQTTATITDSTVQIVVKPEQDLKTLALNFSTIAGSSVWIDDQLQTSGIAHDFSTALTLTLVSADYSTSKTFVVTIANQTTASRSIDVTENAALILAENKILILDDEVTALSITDISGKIYQCLATGNEIDLTALPHGNYVFLFIHNEYTKGMRFVR